MAANDVDPNNGANLPKAFFSDSLKWEICPLFSFNKWDNYLL